MEDKISKILHWGNLGRVGRLSKIEQFVRRKKPQVKHRTFSALFKENSEEWPGKTIARAVKAVIGAVYWDGELEAVKNVMRQLDISIEAAERTGIVGA